MSVALYIMTTVNSAEEHCDCYLQSLNKIWCISEWLHLGTQNFHSAAWLYLVMLCLSVYHKAGIICRCQRSEYNYISVWVYEELAVSKGGHRLFCTCKSAPGCSTSRSPIRWVFVCFFLSLGYPEFVSTSSPFYLQKKTVF